MADQEHDSKAYETQLFEALEIAKVPSTKAYTAVQEVRHMAGVNQSSQFNTLNTKIDALQDVMNAKFDVLHSDMNSKFATAQEGINSNRMLIHTGLGFMGTLIIVGVAILGFLFQIAHKL